MEQTKRLDYIDALKGFAILLVVMGHVLAGYYPSYKDALDANSQGMILWRVIYSFHMPLFMFCSGFVFYKTKEYFSTKNTTSLIGKRFKGLMIPYFAMGLLYLLLTGNLFVYWYLYVLFVFYLVTSIIKWIVSRFKWWTRYVDSFFFIFFSLFIWRLCGKLHNFESIPFLDFGHFSLYIYFIFGMVTRKHEWHLALVSRDIFFLISTVLFFALCLAKFNVIALPTTKLFLLLPFAAIFSFLYYFQTTDNRGKVFYLLQKLGKFSLEIYILHLFFLTKIPWEGTLDVLTCRTSIVLQFVSSLLLSVVNIAICFIIINFISKSSLLNKVLFGR
jgi:peptidoglycan/LPS O-acetylase OafA/YrhL